MEHGSIRASALALSLVVLLGAEVPEVLTERGVAVGIVLLGVEVRNVGGDLAQITATGIDSAGDGRETVAGKLLVGGDRRRTLDLLAQIDSVTVAVGGGGYAVRAEQHLAA